MPADYLLIFTRYPQAGRSKTRLIGELGPEGAARLQRRLTERVVDEARQLAAHYPVNVQIHFCGGDEERLSGWLGPLVYRSQVDGDLGRKMGAAMHGALEEMGTAPGSVVLIGSDIPQVDASLLRQAFKTLARHEVVLGPSRDGGYYLVGLTAAAAPRVLPLLFDDMHWSTETVLAETLGRLGANGCSVQLLPMLRDIDRPEDLALVKELGLL
jgi:rSAM/selenodomain-associated transferase 1